jgi:hypothetical protein
MVDVPVRLAYQAYGMAFSKYMISTSWAKSIGPRIIERQSMGLYVGFGKS